VLLVAVLFLLLTSLLVAAMSVDVMAETTLPVLNLDTGLSYGTIQGAIDADATLNGHKIRVDSGIYYENVVVDKSVSLVGENEFSTVIDGRALGHVIQVVAGNVSFTGFTVQNSMFGYSGIHVYQSSESNISGNIVKNNYNGIYLYGSNDCIVKGNMVSGNEYGIHLYGSANISVSNNIASGNMNGIQLDVSGNNVLADNNVSSNDWNGVYLYGSNANILLGNHVVMNLGRGIRLHYSYNNTLENNDFSRNGYGIYFYGSGGNIIDANAASFNNESGILLFDSWDNAFAGNNVSDNTFGIWLINSGGNGISSNNVFSNNQFGVRLWNSSFNTFFHNNFVGNLAKNIEQPSNNSFGNLWDDGAEGNSWGDYDGANAQVNGIGSKPYIVDERVWLGVYSQDNHPFVGQYLQFSTRIENHSYIVAVVSNFSISGFQFHNGSDHGPNLISFRVNGTEGQGFCRILIPTVLVAAPYVVMDDNASISYSMIRTNGTHSWIYFTFLSSEHELTITSFVPLEMQVWSQWWFWGISGMVLVAAVLGTFAIRYRRKIAEQSKLLQAYSPHFIAQMLFETDVKRRGEKIREFEKKYGVKIRPRDNLQDVVGSFEKKKEQEQS
jgi:nitrous oxidase accessory protein